MSLLGPHDCNFFCWSRTCWTPAFVKSCHTSMINVAECLCLLLTGFPLLYSLTNPGRVSLLCCFVCFFPSSLLSLCCSAAFYFTPPLNFLLKIRRYVCGLSLHCLKIDIMYQLMMLARYSY